MIKHTFLSIIVFILLLFCACSTGGKFKGKPYHSSEAFLYPNENIVYHDVVMVSDVETAVNIADRAFRLLMGDEKFKKQKLVGVAFYEKDDLWVVNRNETDEGLDGVCFFCSIKGSSGEVVKVWTTF